MIRRIVTTINFFQKFAASPSAVVQGRIPQYTSMLFKLNDRFERQQLARAQTRKARKAASKDPLDKEEAELNDDYNHPRENGTWMSEDEYQHRLASIKERRHIESLKLKKFLL